MPDLADLLKRLLDHDVAFVVIGGVAATLHGSSMVTYDLDLCVPFTEENCQRVIQALHDLHPVHRENKQPLSTDPTRIARFKNVYLLTDWGPLDLLGMVSELGDYAAILPNTIAIALYDKSCHVLNIDALITSKRAIARPKDKEVILQLRAIQERIAAKK